MRLKEGTKSYCKNCRYETNNSTFCVFDLLLVLVCDFIVYFAYRRILYNELKSWFTSQFWSPNEGWDKSQGHLHHLETLCWEDNFVSTVNIFTILACIQQSVRRILCTFSTNFFSKIHCNSFSHSKTCCLKIPWDLWFELYKSYE